MSHSLPVLLCAGHLRPLWGGAPSLVKMISETSERAETMVPVLLWHRSIGSSLKVYATIVFTLTKMYSMTVIGNYKDSSS